jgi:hypothetical protein
MRYQILTCLTASAVVFGCASQQETVSNMQPQAVQTAQQRGSFEMNCPSATAQILSKEMIQNRDVGIYSAPQRAEYTVGVEGCGKRMTYLVVCAQGGTGCVAGGSRDNAPTQTGPQQATAPTETTPR